VPAFHVTGSIQALPERICVSGPGCSASTRTAFEKGRLEVVPFGERAERDLWILDGRIGAQQKLSARQRSGRRNQSGRRMEPCSQSLRERGQKVPNNNTLRRRVLRGCASKLLTPSMAFALVPRARLPVGPLRGNV